MHGDDGGRVVDVRRLGPALRRHPAIANLAVVSVVASAARWTGEDVSLLLMDPEAPPWELWRHASSALFHGDILHLLFNLYWLLVFGFIVEEAFGAARTLALTALLALGSGAWQYGLSGPGIGLSGVGYGYFGLLWVLDRTDRRFRGLMEPSFVRLFVGWFFFCIVVTWLDIWHIGNVAHGSGAVMGGVLGWAVSRELPRVRARLAAGGTVVILAAGLSAATLGRPWLHRFNNEGQLAERRAYTAWLKGDFHSSALWYGEAARMRPDDVDPALGLGLALGRLGRHEEAAKAFERALEIDPENEKARRALEGARRASGR